MKIKFTLSNLNKRNVKFKSKYSISNLNIALSLENHNKIKCFVKLSNKLNILENVNKLKLLLKVNSMVISANEINKTPYNLFIKDSRIFRKLNNAN
jgi:hypothetical protein